MSEPVIQIEGVGKHFQQRKGTRNVVLENIDLTVNRGEFVSVVGRSGCGKTTLLRMIGGLAPYQPGTIRVHDRVVRGVPPRVGFVFQSSALLPWKTVRANVETGLNEVRRSLSRQERRRMVDQQLDMMSLSHHGGYLPGALSGGMQQRAGLARALVAEPDVLLMDEPFGAVDALTRLRLQEELASIVERTSATVVFVTHDVEEAVYLADRVAVMSMNPGRIAEIVEVDQPRPRNRRSDALTHLSNHVLELVLSENGTQRPAAEAVHS